MKTKIILPIFFLMVLSLSVFVSASDNYLVEQNVSSLNFISSSTNQECLISGNSCTKHIATYDVSGEGLDSVEVWVSVYQNDITSSEFTEAVEMLAEEGNFEFGRGSPNNNNILAAELEYGDGLEYDDGLKDQYLFWHDNNKIIGIIIDDWDISVITNDDPFEELRDVYLNKYPSELTFIEPDQYLIQEDIGDLSFISSSTNQECLISGNSCTKHLATYDVLSGGLDMAEVWVSVYQNDITSEEFTEGVTKLADNSGFELGRGNRRNNNILSVELEYGDGLEYDDGLKDQYIFWHDKNKVIGVIIDDWSIEEITNDDTFEDLLDAYLNKYPSELTFIEEAEDEPEEPETSCSDTDGGKDYFTKGLLNYTNEEGENFESYDVCTNNSVLVENFCGPNSVMYTCPDICLDGACLNRTVVKPNITEGPEEIEDFNRYYCFGCLVEKSCYPLGYIKDGKYCFDENKTFIEQKKPESFCENNFECDSNLCINNQCVSGSLWAKFIRWLSSIFG